jgi:hypothetical protein
MYYFRWQIYFYITFCIETKAMWKFKKCFKFNKIKHLQYLKKSVFGPAAGGGLLLLIAIFVQGAV